MVQGEARVIITICLGILTYLLVGMVAGASARTNEEFCRMMCFWPLLLIRFVVFTVGGWIIFTGIPRLFKQWLPWYGRTFVKIISGK